MVAEFEGDLIRLRIREGMRVAKGQTATMRAKQPKLYVCQAARLVALHGAGEHIVAGLGDVLWRRPIDGSVAAGLMWQEDRRSLALPGLRPMGSDVRVGVRGRPCVQAVGEVHGKAAARWEVGLADEDDGHARLVGAEPVTQEQRVVGEVLSDEHAILGNRAAEHLSVVGAGEIDVIDRNCVMATAVQLLGGGAGEHLVEEPPHPDIKRSRRSMSSRSRAAARSSAAIRSSTSSGKAT